MAVEAMSGSLSRTTTISTGPNPQTTESTPVAKKEANARQVQLASHEVAVTSANETADAERIRRLEMMMQQMLEQKANSAPPANTQPPSRSSPIRSVDVESTQSNAEPSVSKRAGDGSTSNKRIRLRRIDDEETTRAAPQRRRGHPLDDDRSSGSRSDSDDEVAQEPLIADAPGSPIETTYLPQSSLSDRRNRRTSR